MSENTTKMDTATATANLRSAIAGCVADGEVHPANIADALRKIPAAARGPITAEILRELIVDPATMLMAAEIAGIFANYAEHATAVTRRADVGWPEATAFANAAERYAFTFVVREMLDDVLTRFADAVNMDHSALLAVAGSYDPSAVAEKARDRVIAMAPKPTSSGTRTVHKVTVNDLFDADILRDGESLFHADRGAVATLHDRGEGYAVIIGDDEYLSLSAAADYLTGEKKGPNGWGWFAVERDGSRVLLATLRDALASAAVADVVESGES